MTIQRRDILWALLNISLAVTAIVSLLIANTGNAHLHSLRGTLREGLLKLDACKLQLDRVAKERESSWRLCEDEKGGWHVEMWDE